MNLLSTPFAARRVRLLCVPCFVRFPRSSTLFFLRMVSPCVSRPCVSAGRLGLGTSPPLRAVFHGNACLTSRLATRMPTWARAGIVARQWLALEGGPFLARFGRGDARRLHESRRECYCFYSSPLFCFVPYLTQRRYAAVGMGRRAERRCGLLNSAETRTNETQPLLHC